MPGVRPFSGPWSRAASRQTAIAAISGYVAAKQQHAYSPILAHSHENIHIDWGRLFGVALILVLGMVTNIVVNTHYTTISDSFPFIGVAVWAAMQATWFH